MVRNDLSALSHESTGSAQWRRPVRTCVGCKERVPAADLLRIVVRPSVSGNPQESVVVPDTERRLPGRGAWLHVDMGCLENAERRRAFGRALRVPGTVDTSAVALEIGVRVAAESGDRATPVEKNRQQH